MKHIALALSLVFVGAALAGATYSSTAVTGLGQDDAESAQDAPRRAILVTGASSGLGRRTALHLAENGFFVYAGARKDDDIKALSEIEHVQGIRLDVTVQEDIDAAVKEITAAGRGLHGLINNAGVVVMAPLTEVTEEDLHFQMDVNVYGPYRVTKAFADLLIESQGRVSTTGSISGVATWGLGGPYTMSKHSVEAYTDVLAMELEPLGVQVSVVDPGNFKSRIFASMVERMKKKGYSAKGSRYEAQLTSFLDRDQSRDEHMDPLPVAEAFLDAMTSDTPRRRYMVTPNQREATMTIRAALRRTAELNQGHGFALDAEALHALLDEELERASKR